jgi:hypothetical protein
MCGHDVEICFMNKVMSHGQLPHFMLISSAGAEDWGTFGVIMTIQD